MFRPALFRPAKPRSKPPRPRPELPPFLSAPARAIVLAALSAIPIVCKGFTIDFLSQPAASGPGLAYMLSSSGPCGAEAPCAGPWGDPVRNEAGFNCGGIGDYHRNISWPSEAGIVVLSRMSMGMSHDGLYRCNADRLLELDVTPLRELDVLSLRCDADGACQASVNPATAPEPDRRETRGRLSGNL